MTERSEVPKLTGAEARALASIRDTGNCIGPHATRALRSGLARWNADELRFEMSDLGKAALSAHQKWKGNG